MNQLHDKTYWPIITEILSEDPNFLSENIENIFVCDGGNKVILIKHNYPQQKIKLYLWRAGFSCTQQSFTKRWILLEDLCFNVLLEDLKYDNGWLFILTSHHRLYARSLFHDSFQLNSYEDNFKNKISHRHLLYPFEFINVTGDHPKQLKESYICDQVEKISQGEQYTIILYRNKSKISVIKWQKFDNQPLQYGRQMINNYIINLNDPLFQANINLLFEDIACFSNSWTMLTNQQTLFVQGYFNSNTYFEGLTVIHLRQQKFPGQANVNLRFRKIYATNSQLLLLSNDYHLYSLTFNNQMAIADSFNNKLQIEEVYSHYSTNNFIALTNTKKIYVFSPLFDPKSRNLTEMFLPIKSESIPDAYSIYVMPYETPMVTVKQNFFQWKNDSNKIFFNNPNNSDLRLDILDRKVFVHKNVIGNKEIYFHRCNVEKNLQAPTPYFKSNIQNLNLFSQSSSESTDKSSEISSMETNFEKIDTLKDPDRRSCIIEYDKEERLIYQYHSKVGPKNNDLKRFSMDVLQSYFKYLYHKHQNEKFDDIHFFCSSLPYLFREFIQVISVLDPEYYRTIRKEHFCKFRTHLDLKESIVKLSSIPQKPTVEQPIIDYHKNLYIEGLISKSILSKFQIQFEMHKDKTDKEIQPQRIISQTFPLKEKSQSESITFKPLSSIFSGLKYKHFHIRDLSYWPILIEILKQKPELIQNQCITKMLICDHGNLAIIYQRWKGSQKTFNRLFVWFASFLDDAQYVKKRGKLLYEDDGHPFSQMIYDNGLLFIINRAKQINCIPIITTPSSKVTNSLIELSLNPLLQKIGQFMIPDGLALKVVSNNQFTLLLSQSITNHIDTYILLWRWIPSTSTDKPRVASKTYLLTYQNFLSKFSQKNDCFIDVACTIGGGHFILSAFNLLFATESLSPKLNMRGIQQFNLKEYFPDEIILQMFATKTRLLFLTESGNLFGFRLDLPMISGNRFQTFGPMILYEDIECLQVYSDYTSARFLTLVKHKDRFRYFVFIPQLSSDGFQEVDHPIFNNLVETSLYMSIPETYSLFLNGETPYMTRLSSKCIQHNQSNSLLFGFNDPTIPNQMKIKLNNRYYFVDPNRLSNTLANDVNYFEKFFSNFLPNILDSYLRYCYTKVFIIDASLVEELKKFIEQIQKIDTNLSAMTNVISNSSRGEIIIKQGHIHNKEYSVIEEENTGSVELVFEQSPAQKVENTIINIDCWPLLYEIRSKKPELLLEQNLKQIFICDKGQVAIMIVKQLMLAEHKIKNNAMVIWLATYVYDRRPNPPWFILEEFDGEKIVSIHYDHKLLFLIDDQQRLYCRNILQKSDGDQIVKCHRKLFTQKFAPIDQDRFIKCKSGETYMVALNNDKSDSVVYVYQFPVRPPNDNLFQQQFVTNDNLYTFSSAKFLTKHYLPLMPRHEPYQIFMIDRFIDIACFQHGFAMLTEKQLIFLFGNISNDLNFPYPKYYCIDLKVQFKIYYIMSTTNNGENVPKFQIVKIFPTKTRLILLSNNHKLFFIKLNVLKSAAIDRFPLGAMTLIDRKKFHEVYSDYSSTNFITIGEDGESWYISLYTEPSINDFNYRSANLLKRTSIFRSIPDAFATFVKNETPIMTKISLEKNLDTTTFNDPTYENCLKLTIQDHAFYVNRNSLNNWNTSSLINFLEQYPINFSYSYLRYLHTGLFQIDYDYSVWLTRFIEHIQDLDQLFYRSAKSQNLQANQQSIVIQKLDTLKDTNLDIHELNRNQINLSTFPEFLNNLAHLEAKNQPQQMIFVNNPITVFSNSVKYVSPIESFENLLKTNLNLSNMIEDISHWPLLNDILTKDPEFLNNVEQIFICDKGCIAIVQQNFNEAQKTLLNLKYRTYAWFATFAYQRQPLLPWVSLDHLEPERIIYAYYDNGWLFTIDAKNNFKCRNIFIPSVNYVPANDQYEYSKRLEDLFPLNANKKQIDWNNIQRFSSSELYTVLLVDVSDLWIWRWSSKLKSDYSRHCEYLVNIDENKLFTSSDAIHERRLLDVACFQQGFAVLSPGQIFLFGRMSPHLSYEDRDYACIIIKDTFAKIYPIRFWRLFATKNRLLLLSEDGVLCYLQIDWFHAQNTDFKLPQAFGTMFQQEQDMKITNVFSHYSSSNFIVTTDSPRAPLWVFVSLLSNETKLEKHGRLVQINCQSIPDVYSLWVNGETPFFSRISDLNLENIYRRCRRFNDPMNESHKALMIHGRMFFVDANCIDLINQWPPQKFQNFFSKYPLNFVHSYLLYLHNGCFEIDSTFYQLLQKFIQEIRYIDSEFSRHALNADLRPNEKNMIVILRIDQFQ